MSHEEQKKERTIHIHVKLEICVPGHYKDKEKMDKLLYEVQNQINQVDRPDIVASYYMSQEGEEKTWDEMKEFLTKLSPGRYLVFTDESYSIPSDFIKSKLIYTKRPYSNQVLNSQGIIRNPKFK